MLDRISYIAKGIYLGGGGGGGGGVRWGDGRHVSPCVFILRLLRQLYNHYYVSSQRLVVIVVRWFD